MSMPNQVRIKTDELPPRTRGLNPGEISKVFGGCTGWQQMIGGGASGRGKCTSNSDCCPPLTCKYGGTDFFLWDISWYECK
jgi:hypothetical protein